MWHFVKVLREILHFPRAKHVAFQSAVQYSGHSCGLINLFQSAARPLHLALTLLCLSFDLLADFSPLFCSLESLAMKETAKVSKLPPHSLCHWRHTVSLCLLLLPQTDDPPPSNSDTVFFRDGVRRIDFVLAYVDDKDVEKRQVRHKWRPFFSRRVVDICMLPPMCNHGDSARGFCVSRQCLVCSFSGEAEGV